MPRIFGAETVRLETSRGAAHARNAGARMADTEYILFLDADVLVPTDLVDRIRTFLARNPDVDALFGSYDQDPDKPDFWSQYRNLLHHYIHQHASPRATTFWTGCGIVRKSAFDRTGGFDNRRLAIEDIDLGSRLHHNGYRIHLENTLLVKHLKRWTFFSIIMTDIFHRALPWSRLIMERRELRNDLNLTTGCTHQRRTGPRIPDCRRVRMARPFHCALLRGNGHYPCCCSST
jgi:GT2 family glycosyltransferase